MRHRASQGVGAIGLVAAACLLLLNPLASFWKPPDAAELRVKLIAEVEAAVERSGLTADQRMAFQQAGVELRHLLDARHRGEEIDRARAQALRQFISKTIESGAFQPADRERIHKLMEDLRSAAREEQARWRRETLMRQLGFPLGLLADWAVSQQGS